MAILGLQQRGTVKYVVSQNGLHLRSGYAFYLFIFYFLNIYKEKTMKRNNITTFKNYTIYNKM